VDVTTALLCDLAQVRDGLLYVLSGGVTRVLREAYPSQMGVSYALVLELDRIEAERPHQVEIVAVGEDGEEAARLEANVQIGATSARPGEGILVPFALDLRTVPLPKPGAYELRVYVDGSHRRTTQFWAEQVQTELL
jgi:hypothetical protein